jgi:hypothetical protein
MSTGCRTKEGLMKLPTSSINLLRRVSGRSQGTVFSRENLDSRGAAAARLLLRTTLDPLSGFTAVNRIHTVTKPLLFTEVNI